MRKLPKEEEELLFKDLSQRLYYKVKCNVYGRIGVLIGLNDYGAEIDYGNGEDTTCEIKFCLPYLRPLSSMTEEERAELEHLSEEYFGKALDKQIQESLSSSNRNESEILEYIASSVIVDWLLAHHFDFRNLIDKGLAIEVTEENNPYK